MTEVQTQKLQALRSYMQEIKDRENPESYLIGILHKVQDVYGYLPREMMDEVAQTLLIPTAHIWGVATFYHYFNLEPIGQHVISVCMGTACYVKGSQKVLDKLAEYLEIPVGKTTEDGLFTLQATRCLGACGLAPVLTIGEEVYGRVTPDQVAGILDKYRED